MNDLPSKNNSLPWLNIVTYSYRIIDKHTIFSFKGISTIAI